MARSIRVLYRGQQGTIRKNFDWPPIRLDSAVVITAAEFNFVEGLMGGPKTLGRPHLGAASIYVTNVGPHGAAPKPVASNSCSMSTGKVRWTLW